jgi:1-acyl-sn-glycerol-3-phosphate acyltransferase
MQVISSSLRKHYAQFFGATSNDFLGTKCVTKDVVIPASTHPVLTPFWRWYIQNSLRGHFAAVRLALPNQFPRHIPMLWHATHVSFWDGYLALQAARFLELEYRVMMLEDNLKKFSFLRYAGAFGLERGTSRGALESLRYAANQLQDPNPRAMLMFPSGEIGSPHLRPLPFESGIATLAGLAAKQQELLVCPLAIRLEYGTEEKPEAFLRFGQPRRVQAGNRTTTLSALFADDLTRTADKLHQDLLQNQLEPYQTILRGNTSLPEWWAGVQKRFAP